MQHGFRSIVVAEACGDRSPAIHDANIADLQSTSGDERRHNPALPFTDESAFIDWLLRTAPPMPRLQYIPPGHGWESARNPGVCCAA